MHQMRISTNEVSSVVLRPKELEIQKKNKKQKKQKKNIVKSVKEPKKLNTGPWNWTKSVEG